jgi:hypothetical protein
VSGLLLAYAGLSARAQHGHGTFGYTAPEQLAITAKRERLDQDEKNIAVQQTGITEFESRAQTIRRQLEALSFMAEGEMPSRLREYGSEMHKELKALERHIETAKDHMAAETLLISADRSQLNAQEERYKEKFAADRLQVEKSPGDEYQDRIEQQNARLREEATQPQAQIALQNQRLMQEVEAPSRSGQGPPGVPVRPTSDYYDGDELKLCVALEKKVVEKDYDIAEINLLAAKGLPGG